MAEIDEAINILNLELLMRVASEKARLLMNIDIVNPIPPNKPIPVRFFHVTPSCKLAKPVFTNKNGIEKMPSSLPTERPRIIPKELEEAIESVSKREGHLRTLVLP